MECTECQVIHLPRCKEMEIPNIPALPKTTQQYDQVEGDQVLSSSL